jgi:succinate dehydrogenase/fumarate reductase cytochrome b subunit
MENLDEKQTIIDNEHLKLLSIFHYISGGITLAFALFMGAYFFLIFYLFSSAEFQKGINPEFNNNLPEAFFTIMMTIFMIIFILGLLFGIGQIVSGRLMKLRQVRWFSFAVGIINLLNFPYGTILGIFTIMVLERDSIRKQYIDQG